MNDRAWWRRLYKYGHGRRAKIITKAYRWGIISDWQLWEVLTQGPMPWDMGAGIYGMLGFLPVVSYPLQSA